MLIVYEKLTKKQLAKTLKDTIKGVSEWFEKNPKRKVCRVEWVYGKKISVRRGKVAEDLQAAADKTDLK